MWQNEKKVYREYNFKKCDVTGKEYHSCAVRLCPNPDVLKQFGRNGKVHVSIGVCKKCGFGVRERNLDAVRCGYEKGLCEIQP